MFLAHGVMIDVTHHIDHFARDSFEAPASAPCSCSCAIRQRRGSPALR